MLGGLLAARGLDGRCQSGSASAARVRAAARRPRPWGLCHASLASRAGATCAMLRQCYRAIERFCAMYAATDGGTRPSSDSPRAARWRISVDETSGVSASIRMMRGVVARRDVARLRSCARPARQPLAQRVERGARPRDDDEVGGVEDVGIAMPGGDFCKRIGADDEENLQRRSGPRREVRASVSNVYDGPSRCSSRSDTSQPAPSSADRRRRRTISSR